MCTCGAQLHATQGQQGRSSQDVGEGAPDPVTHFTGGLETKRASWRFTLCDEDGSVKASECQQVLGTHSQLGMFASCAGVEKRFRMDGCFLGMHYGFYFGNTPASADDVFLTPPNCPKLSCFIPNTCSPKSYSHKEGSFLALPKPTRQQNAEFAFRGHRFGSGCEMESHCYHSGTHSTPQCPCCAAGGILPVPRCRSHHAGRWPGWGGPLAGVNPQMAGRHPIGLLGAARQTCGPKKQRMPEAVMAFLPV